MTTSERGPMGAFEGYGDYEASEQQAVTVAQDDREAAATFSEAVAGKSNGRDAIAECRAGKQDATFLVQAFARHRLASVSSASAEGWVPERFTLSERELDDECGCPEETWDTPFGTLNMHLTAGKPSNACLDNGDEGEWSIDLTRATIDDARTAFFAWSMIAASLPTASPEPVPATNQAGEVEDAPAYSFDINGDLETDEAEPRAIEKDPFDWVAVSSGLYLGSFERRDQSEFKMHVGLWDVNGMSQNWPEVPNLRNRPSLATQPATSPMRMAVDRDWLAAKIAADPDAECEAGVMHPEAIKPATSQEGEGGFEALHQAVRSIGAATPTPPTLSEDLREGVVAWLYERKGCDPVVEKDAHRWMSANGWTETPLCRAALNARGGA